MVKKQYYELVIKVSSPFALANYIEINTILLHLCYNDHCTTCRLRYIVYIAKLIISLFGVIPNNLGLPCKNMKSIFINLH